MCKWKFSEDKLTIFIKRSFAPDIKEPLHATGWLTVIISARWIMHRPTVPTGIDLTKILGGQTKILGGKVVKSDKCMGYSHLFGETCQGYDCTQHCVIT